MVNTRPAYRGSTMRLTMYVPRAGSQPEAFLAPGSAVVARPDGPSGRVRGDASGGIVTCYYEGNVGNRASNLMDYYSKLCCAAGRLATNYPTSAADGFRLDDLIEVGVFDAARSVVESITDPRSLEAWCGEEAEAITGRRIAPGRAEWAEAAKVAQPPHSHPLGRQRLDAPHGLWFRTQAGQVVRFVTGEGRREAWVFEGADPRLPELLAPLGLDPREPPLGLRQPG